jgi:two-component system, OmpR family, KDP operon response regulator KdpE
MPVLMITSPSPSAWRNSWTAPIELGDFKIDPGARSVSVKDRTVHLTPKEFDVLLYLARHAGKVVTHRVLLGAVWGGERTEQVEYLRVFVAQLRKKIEPSPNSPRYILTDPWVGYRFEPGDPIRSAKINP